MACFNTEVHSPELCCLRGNIFQGLKNHSHIGWSPLPHRIFYIYLSQGISVLNFLRGSKKGSTVHHRSPTGAQPIEKNESMYLKQKQIILKLTESQTFWLNLTNWKMFQLKLIFPEMKHFVLNFIMGNWGEKNKINLCPWKISNVYINSIFNWKHFDGKSQQVKISICVSSDWFFFFW